MKSRRLLFPLAVASAFFTGCQQDKITSAWVPKEAPPAMPALPATPSAPGEITWTLPTGWTTKPAGQMRLGSFSFEAKDGYSVDISVVKLAGEAGGDMANINRWRGQIQLKPVDETKGAPPTVRSFSKRSMTYVRLASDAPLVDNKHPMRILGAIYHQNETTTWFFKAIGEDGAVKELEPGFDEFLKSLRFHE